MQNKTNSINTKTKNMSSFKNEVAKELGVNLKENYNGELTSKEAGSIGGEMVRRIIKSQKDQMK